MPKFNRQGKAEVLTQVDYQTIREHLSNPRHRLFLDIAQWTGEKWGAIRLLQVGDCYANPVLCLPRETIRFQVFTRRDTPGGFREVPCPSRLQEILMCYNPPIKGSEYLFPGRGGNPIGSRACDLFFRQAVKRAGLDSRGFSTYSTKRTSILQQQGADVRTIAAIAEFPSEKAIEAV